MDIVRQLDLGSFCVVPLLDDLLLLDLRSCAEPDVRQLERQLQKASTLIHEERAAAAAYLREEGVMEVIERLDEARPGAFPPDFADLERLHRAVRALRPNRVLEMGSGWSTYVLAHAIAENGAGSLLSVDADEAWASANRRALPEAWRENVEIRHTPARIGTIGAVPVLEHVGLPEESFDFLYLDGPALYPMVRVAADVLRLEPHMAPGATLVVDGRHENVLFLADRLERSWTKRSEGLCCVENGFAAKDLIVRHSVFTLDAA